MEKMLHLAAQYLAAAGINFVPKKEDDSHTNLGFSVETGLLSSRSLNGAGDTLSLDYNDFSLHWGTTEPFPLDGRTHDETLQWIVKKVQDAGIEKPYNYQFHYDLPYEIFSDFKFQLLDMTRLHELRELRVLAQEVLTAFMAQQQLTSEIRIWSHHFDTGGFTPLGDGTGRAVGFGLSIPDTLVNDHYFYISGYQGHDGLDTSSFPDLTKGTWHNEGFKGAVLPTKGIDLATATTFFNEALTAYKN